MKITKSLFQTLPLAIIFLGLLGYNYINATWTAAPTSGPTGNNAEAPLNVGSVKQNKVGTLTTNGSFLADRNVVGRILAADTQVRSDLYCDSLGKNCFDQSDFLILPKCADGKILIAETGGWICGNPGAAPAPVKWLVNSQHSEAQCTSLGGSVVTADGEKVCQFNRAGCPGGWAQFKNWSTRPKVTTGNACPALTFPQTCTWPGNIWSNTPSPATRPLYCDGTGDNDNAQSSCSAPTSQVGCY